MVAVAIGGAAVLGAATSVIGGNRAARAQTTAATSAAANERYFYDTTRSDLAPWRQAGTTAVNSMLNLYGLPGGSAATAGTTGGAAAASYGGLQTSPGYQFRRDEGIRALERSASARGNRTGSVYGMSGATARAVQRYGDGLAASEYDSYASRLAQLAGFGQSATTTTAAAGSSAASGISSALTAAGNARASGYANTASSINTGFNNALSAYLTRGSSGSSFYNGNPNGIY